MKNVLNFCAAAVFAALTLAALWAAFAIVGISEGSTDLCTESFKAAVAAIVR